VTAEKYDVGTLPTADGEKVALIMDHNLPTEIGFAIAPDHATELGQQLIDEAAKAKVAPPRSH